MAENVAQDKDKTIFVFGRMGFGVISGLAYLSRGVGQCRSSSTITLTSNVLDYFL